ncbi:hypothetical protein L3Y34_019525 [Caenorhabditis briggsae]|uniref:Uncharacterized protein n=1 Tax=Caenorhabditis briggsae TaxID=6238 RepID=A0AAE9DP73_CAEBR|nr:hypothetical protein L3Y34_019525 [Caenorhabditis briggsae]
MTNRVGIFNADHNLGYLVQFIAQDDDEMHYCLHSNGSTTTYSGHFLFTAPLDAILEIAGQQFHGRHDELQLHPIKLSEELPPHLTHEEVDEIEKNLPRWKKLDELHPSG